MRTFHDSIPEQHAERWRRVSRVTRPTPQVTTRYHRMPPETTGNAVINNPPPVSSAVDRSILRDLLEGKQLDELTARGGTEGIAASLGTHLEWGIQGDKEDISRRARDFGTNLYVNPTPPRNLFHFLWEAFKDPAILILVVCAALLFGFGIEEQGLREGWYDGVIIFVLLSLYASVSAITNLRRDRVFDHVSHINNAEIVVVRNGVGQKIPKSDIVVGDVVLLHIGDEVPTGGLLINEYSLRVDESDLTGGSNNVRVTRESNPFLFSGSVVTNGFGTMLVISVGMDTSWRQITDSDEQTALQAQLDKLTSSVCIVAYLVAFLVLVVTLVRHFTGNTEDDNGKREFDESKAKAGGVIYYVVRNIAYAAVIVISANMATLGSLVTLTLAYFMKKMMHDKAMVRKLSACQVMGSATTICTNKTGTLTLNQMTVTKFWIEKEAMVGRHYTLIPGNVLKLLQEGVGLNTAHSFYKLSTSGTNFEISTIPTEKAILTWAKLELNMDMEAVQRDCNIVQVESFNSERMRSGILMKKVQDGTCHVHWKGAAEKILAMCSHFYDAEGNRKALNDRERREFDETIQGMAASSLRCIAFAHGQVSEASQNEIQENGLTLLGLVGLKNPCRPNVKEAVQGCQVAGVNVKMITGDNILTAKAIATECGILQHRDHDGLVIEGVEFSSYTEDERLEKIDKIRVMARASLSDRHLLLQCLKRKGHVVAVTGDGTNDAPFLKEADIGLSLGIQGTEVAKENSDIVLLDDNFATIAAVVRWGRSVYVNLQKFIQFHLTGFATALTISLVSAASSGKAPFTPAQLLWVILLLVTLGAFALATEEPTIELMQKPPVGLSEPLISNIVLRNIIGESVYQIAAILVLMFGGKLISGNETDTLVFTTFVLLLVVNLFNAREVEGKNVFKGILENKWFIGIVGVIIVIQIIMVELLNKISHTEKLDWKEWGVSGGFAAFSLVIGVLIKFIPVPKRAVDRAYSGCLIAQNPSFDELLFLRIWLAYAYQITHLGEQVLKLGESTGVAKCCLGIELLCLVLVG